MRTREEIEAKSKSWYNETPENEAALQPRLLLEVQLDCRELLQQLVRGKVQHTVVVKGDGTLSPEDIARIQKTVKNAQAERDGDA
jgi:phage FluMu protein gp41